MGVEDGKMTEYQSLRVEISQNDALIQKINMFGFWAIALPLIAFAYKHDTELLMLPPVAYFVYFQMVGHKLEGIIRIASYISTFLEPEIPGLGWETKLKFLSKKISPMPAIQTHSALLIMMLAGTIVPSITASRGVHAYSSAGLAVIVGIYTLVQLEALKNLAGEDGFQSAWKSIREGK